MDRDGEPVTLRPKQLVLATGMSARALTCPEVAGCRAPSPVTCTIRAVIRAAKAYAGKRCVVIGSNNSAHDICADLWEHGADVTMVQRSSTHVARSDTLMELALGATLLRASPGCRHRYPSCADMIFASLALSYSARRSRFRFMPR